MNTIKMNNRYNIGDSVILKKNKLMGSIEEIRKVLKSENFNIVISYRGIDQQSEDVATYTKKNCQDIFKNNFYVGYSVQYNKCMNIAFDKSEIYYIINIDGNNKLVKENEIKGAKS